MERAEQGTCGAARGIDAYVAELPGSARYVELMDFIGGGVQENHQNGQEESVPAAYAVPRKTMGEGESEDEIFRKVRSLPDEVLVFCDEGGNLKSLEMEAKDAGDCAQKLRRDGFRQVRAVRGGLGGEAEDHDGEEYGRKKRDKVCCIFAFHRGDYSGFCRVCTLYFAGGC